MGFLSVFEKLDKVLKRFRKSPDQHPPRHLAIDSALCVASKPDGGEQEASPAAVPAGYTGAPTQTKARAGLSVSGSDESKMP